ncbi:MAG: SPOR domain-containing protein [Oxalobacter formigenes]|nr:SPOR domain-containing protein [Oxalobacter formigenes]
MARKSSSENFRYAILWKNNTVLGFVCGLITGLFIAVMIAMIITRAPMPFNSGPAKQEKNQTEEVMPFSDPNRPLYGNREAAKEAYQNALVEATPDDPLNRAANTPEATASIQAGAYREKKDAEQIRAKLALLGIEASIREAHSRGNTLYRVHLGPYAPKKLEATQNKLRENGIDFITTPSR